jgi:hypothetical protein
MFSFHLVLILRSRFSYFFMFLTFKDLTNVKWTQSFCHAIFSTNRRTREELKGELREAEERPHHAGQESGHMVGPTFHLLGPIFTNIGFSDSSWPKTDYIYPLWWFRDGGGRETQNTPNKSTDCEDRKGMLPKSILVAPLTLLTPYPLAPWWRGSSSPPGLWHFGSNLYQTLMLCWLESHELPIIIVTIFFLPLWWILCLWDDLWDAKMFMFLMYE